MSSGNVFESFTAMLGDAVNFDTSFDMGRTAPAHLPTVPAPAPAPVPIQPFAPAPAPVQPLAGRTTKQRRTNTKTWQRLWYGWSHQGRVNTLVAVLRERAARRPGEKPSLKDRGLGAVAMEQHWAEAREIFIAATATAAASVFGSVPAFGPAPSLAPTLVFGLAEGFGPAAGPAPTLAPGLALTPGLSPAPVFVPRGISSASMPPGHIPTPSPPLRRPRSWEPTPAEPNKRRRKNSRPNMPSYQQAVAALQGYVQPGPATVTLAPAPTMPTTQAYIQPSPFVAPAMVVDLTGDLSPLPLPVSAPAPPVPTVSLRTPAPAPMPAVFEFEDAGLDINTWLENVGDTLPSPPNPSTALAVPIPAEQTMTNAEATKPLSPPPNPDQQQPSGHSAAYLSQPAPTSLTAERNPLEQSFAVALAAQDPGMELFNFDAFSNAPQPVLETGDAAQPPGPVIPASPIEIPANAEPNTPSHLPQTSPTSPAQAIVAEPRPEATFDDYPFDNRYYHEEDIDHSMSLCDWVRGQTKQDRAASAQTTPSPPAPSIYTYDYLGINDDSNKVGPTSTLGALDPFISNIDAHDWLGEVAKSFRLFGSPVVRP